VNQFSVFLVLVISIWNILANYN